MFPDWIEVVTPFHVQKIIHLVLTNSDNGVLKEYLSERFYNVLKNRAISPESFDDEATTLLIQIIRSNYSNHDMVYTTLKSFVYHTFMYTCYQMNTDEVRLLRYKLRKILDPTAVY